jgi:hypothetical protein
MTPNAIQNICLAKEVYNSTMLIKKGFAELQQINGSNDFYHPPILLISSGFERLMKCIICYWHLKINKKYPSYHILIKAGGNKGHDINVLLQNIIDICTQFKSFGEHKATKDDLDFLINDKRLHRIVGILSDFAQGGRYYYLDIVSSGSSGFNDPESKWGELETEVVMNNSHLKKIMMDFSRSDEFFDGINTILITYLERFARALSRIFTLGELHPDAQKCYAYISDFLGVMDHK